VSGDAPADAPPRPAKKRKKRKKGPQGSAPEAKPAARSRERLRAKWFLFGAIPWTIYRLFSPEEPRTEETPDIGPAFARQFPHDRELERLVTAFEAGNYALVREAAPRLAQQTESDEVRRAARELRRRVDPDPLMVYLVGVAALLLGVLAYWYWSHPHVGS
jgi:hypothetical protein